MNPAAGTFLQRDPLGYVDRMNLYNYCRISPSSLTDPLGLTTEKKAWKDSEYQKYLDNYLKFWLEWLGARELHDGRRSEVSPECKKKLECIIRAMSWVESRHGTGAGKERFPEREPMQVGNPDDAAHQSIVGGGIYKDERGLVREGKLNGVPQYKMLPARVERPYPPDGHRDKDFGPDDSFFWGISWYFIRTNQADILLTPPAAWNLGNCSWERIINGAARYNGTGDPNCRMKIKEALKLSSCIDDDC